MSTSSQPPQDDDTKPLWNYVTKIKSVGGGGGNYEVKCSICDITFNGSYTRVRAHLLKITGKGVRACKKVTPSKLVELKKIDNEATLRLEKSKAKSVPLPPVSNESPMDNIDGVDLKRRKTSGQLEKAFNMQARETLDNEIARMFFSSGLPFHLARNPYYRRAFSFAANNYISGYQPPGYNKLRTSLLQNERRHVERLLEPIKNSWSQKGVRIVSDRWSDPQRRPLINFIAVTESGPMFLKAIECSDEIKDRDFIAKQMRDIIMEVGPSNVVQIVTDNAPVCRAAGLIIEADFPSIYWTPCVVHTLNLALKNICAPKNTEKNIVAYESCSWITKISEDAMFIKNFIMGHSMRLSIFNSFNSLELLSVAPTRFSSTIVMLKRFKQLKKGLQEMVISDEWSSYKEDDVGKAKFVKDTLLDDVWWDKVDYILSFTTPIYDVLRKMDTEASSLHLVYEMWDSLIEKVRKAIYRYERKVESEESSFYKVVHSILIARWTKCSTPLHCLAHSLNPRYYSHEWLSEDSNRAPPHQDTELTLERMKCFKRYFVDVDVRRQVNVEFANFSDGREGFDDIDSLGDRGKMGAKSWWLVHGAHAPILQKVALKLLAQPCSSSCCERNWSTYSFIHSMKRNKLAPHKAEDLVFVHSNIRLLSRNSPQYHQEETKMWDIAGDEFGSLDECGILEVANLSLDEPELEAMFFNDDDQGGHQP
ncbi:Ribonuclease H-like superfamily [Sesbania bispinosa]|nr:Ribonuclease H-like superfamily [Sesbania bispinosa]